MEDAITLVLYLVIIAIVGVVTLIRKVMENRGSGEDGKRVSLAEAVQEQMNRYLKGGPPGRLGGRGWGGEDEERTDRPPPQAPPVLLTREAPPQTPPPRSPPEPAGRRTPAPVPRRVKPGIDAMRTLVQQSAAPEVVVRSGSRYGRNRGKVTRKDLRKAVLLAEILGPPVAERREYRLF